MSNKKATKRALLTSITALAMCVVMLVGTTFAWFTDTATANVNKIQAGKLDVALEMFDTAQNTWVTAEGKTLEFKKADAAPSGEKVLWEPGATYELPKLRVVNNGNLNIKCRVEVTGIKKVTTAATPAGTFDLNDVIAWTATGLDLDTNFIMESTDDAKEFTISGTMDTAAGNDYQGLTIDGVSITVYATQAEGEFDSNRDDYDKDATYTRTNATVIDETTGKTVTLEKGKSYTVGTATITVSDSGDITYVNNERSGQKVTINTDGGNLTVDAANDTVYHYGGVGIVTVTAVAGDSYHEFGNASVLAIATGRAVIEKADAIKVLQVTGDNAIIAVPQNVVVDTKLEKAADVNTIVINTIDNNGAVVNKTTITGGIATTTKGEDESAATPNELSNIIKNGKAEVGTAKEYAAMIGSTGYASLAEAVAAAKDGETITLLKSTNGDGIQVETEKFATEGLTVDFNGHTYTVGGVLVGSSGTGTNAFQLLQGGKVTFKNGSIVGVTEGTKPAEGTDWNGAPAIMIQNYCNLTLDNMIVTGGDETVYTMSNNNGVVVIKNTTINAGGAKGYGYGPYAFDVCRYSNYPSVNVTVTGNSVINGDVEVSGEIGNGQSRQLTINSGEFYGKFKVANEPANITINGGEFVDLANAVKYVTDGATIKLAEDTQGSGVKVESGKNFTIDLNGYTYTVAQPLVGSTGTETNAFQFLMNSNITIKNGKMGAGDSLRCAYYFQNYANLTLQDVEVTIDNCRACEAVVHSMNGVVKVIGNTTINASGDYFWNVTDKGVRKAIMVMDWNNNSYSNGTQVTVNTTGTINGMVHAGYYNVSDKGATSGKSALVLENGIFNGVLSQEATSGGYEATPFTIVGGTFNTDPTAFVDTTTHTVSNDGSVWTVTKNA